MPPGRPQPVPRKISLWRARRGWVEGKLRMTDAPGNSSQNATLRRAQGLGAADEVRILGRWKYFERYSEKGRVPVVRTQSAFGLQSMWGNQKSEERRSEE